MKLEILQVLHRIRRTFVCLGYKLYDIFTTDWSKYNYKMDDAEMDRIVHSLGPDGDFLWNYLCVLTDRQGMSSLELAFR